MKKQIIAGVLSLFFVLFSLQPAAQPRHKGEGGPGHERMMKELNLTDQQEEQISKLRSEHQVKMIDARAEIKKLEVQLNDEKRKTDLDEDKILSLTKKIGELRADLQTKSTEMWLNVYNLLDDKQKEIWKEHRPKRLFRKEMRKEHMKERIDRM